MKLDLDAIQRNKDTCECTELQQKRDKFAYFEKECSQILHHIYLGSEVVAKNRKTLQEKGITHVLNCVGFVCPDYFPKDLIYKKLWLQDSPTEDITSILYDVFDFFEEVREEGGRVFVHCCQGVSRSTSLVIAYLMWVDKQTFENAFQYVRFARGVTNPNMGFACQLLQCQKRMHAIPISPKSTLRMYRITPHSVHDPMHLVPKKINNPHFAALDSRGAFVVLTPNILFVWQGLKCDTNMASAAHHFTSQVIRYEKANGHTLHVFERQEPGEFWNAFKKNESNIDTIINLKSIPYKNNNLILGKNSHFINEPILFVKEIPLYDKDFETYMKAKHDKLMPKDNNKGVDFTTHGPQDSGWIHFKKKLIDGLEKSFLKTCEDFHENIIFEDEKTISLEKIELKNCKEVEKISKSLSSLDALQSSSSSSFSFHSFLLNSLQSPPTTTSPCLSPPPSPTPSISNLPSLQSSCNMLSSTFSQIDCPTMVASISSLSPSYEKLDNQATRSLSKDSSSSRSSKITKNNDLNVEPNISISVNEDVFLSKTNPQIPTTSNENTKECNSTVLQTSTTRYKRDVSIKTFEEVSNICVKNKSFDSSFEACCSFQKEEKGESSSSRCNGKQGNDEFAPVLFEWPQMEKIDMFDVDDLDSNGAFVLLVTNIFDKTRSLYLWVGSFLQIENNPNSTMSDGNFEEQIVRHWQHIGKDLIYQLQIHKDTHVEVFFNVLYN